MRTTILLLCLLPAVSLRAAEPLESGRRRGEKVPSFYVRAVTGPLRNRTVCYVCRNGARPVVMVLMRDIERPTAPLLKGIDKIVDAHRADGLRSFGVLVSDDSRSATSRVQTLSFDAKLAVPLTVGSVTVAEEGCQDLHPDAAMTVVLYREQRVVESFAFRKGELDKDGVGTVLAAVRAFIEPDDD
jgi:hypothetical protein